MLEAFLLETENENFLGFYQFQKQINDALQKEKERLSTASEAIKEPLKALSLRIESILGEAGGHAGLFTDSLNGKRLTEEHAHLLITVEKAEQRLSDLFEHSLASQPKESECTAEIVLRLIALSACQAPEELFSFYEACIHSEPFAALARFSEQLTDLLVLIRERMTDFTTDASHILTQINRGTLPQIAYRNYLQAELLLLHDRRKQAEQIKNEVHYVKISDVL